MNYESLQLVAYDGEKIPSGYLFGDISAQFAITYLKSLDAPESAIKKVKEVEISKLLYGISLIKSATQDDSQLGNIVLSHEGKQYGAGTGNPVPGSVIHTLNTTGSLPDEWTMTQAPQESNEDFLNQPVYIFKRGKDLLYSTQKPKGSSKQVTIADLYKAAATKKTKTVVVDKSDPNKKLCSMSYQGGSSSIVVDKLGKLPNIWANLLAAVGSFDKTQKETLEEMFNTAKGKFSVDLQCIPEEYRDELVQKVMNPDTHYSEILGFISEKSGVEAGNILRNGMSDRLVKELGIELSEHLFDILNNSDFISIVNNNLIPRSVLSRVFPVMDKAITASGGKLPENFQFSKEMFLVTLNQSPESVQNDIHLLVKALSENYIGISALFRTSDDTGRRGAVQYMKSTDILLTPLAYSLNTEGKEGTQKLILSLSRGQMEPEVSLAAAKEIAEKFSSSEKLKSLNTKESEFKEGYIADEIKKLKLSPEADTLLGFAVKEFANQLRRQPPSTLVEKYAAKTGKGEYRNPMYAYERVDGLVPTVKNDVSPEQTQRNLNLTTGMIISSIAAFGSKSRESEWISGKDHLVKSLNVLNAHSPEPIHIADLLPFAKTSPLVIEGEGVPSRITYITNDNKIMSVNVGEHNQKEVKDFAEFVIRDLKKLAGSGVINSERALASTLLMRRPDLAEKIKIQDVNSYYTSESFKQAHSKVADIVGGFVSAFMDPSVGGSRDTVLAGGVSGKSEAVGALEELAKENPELLKNYIQNPPQSLQDELSFRDILSKQYKPDIVDDLMKIMTNGVQYDLTMELLSNPDNVMKLISGQYPDVESSFQMDKVMLSAGKFDPSSVDFSAVFKGDTDADKKAQAVKNALVYYISNSAKEELVRRKGQSLRNYGSVRRHSDSFEPISSIAQVVAELKTRRNETIEEDYAPRFSTLSQEINIRFSGGDIFTSGLRKNLDAGIQGGQMDMIGMTTNKKDRTLSIDGLELKVGQSRHQVAEINSSHQLSKALDSIVSQENPDTIIIKPIMNLSVSYGKSSGLQTRDVRAGKLAFDMTISSGTSFGADGNIGSGVLR